MFRNALSPREIAACANLGPAVKPTVVDQRFALCLYCQIQTGQVCASDQGGRVCRCPECGPVPVNADDMTALVLDEPWLRAKLRLALDINSRDGIDELGDGVWPLGEARRAPVLLARTLTRVWGEPALFDRVRVPGAAIRVIAPRARETRGAPFGPGIEQLSLEERFAFYGGGIAFIPSADAAAQGAAPARSRRAGRLRPLLGGLPVGDAVRLASRPDPLHRWPGGNLQGVMVVQGRTGDGRTDHGVRWPGQRQAERSVQGEDARQGQARSRGAVVRLPNPRQHAPA